MKKTCPEREPALPYLERRIEHLLELLREDRLHLLAPNRRELAEDLYNIRRLPDGRIDLSSCSFLVRSVARAIYQLRDAPAGDEVVAEGFSPEAPQRLITDQRAFFAILGEFFHCFTGALTPAEFATPDDLFAKMKREGEKLVRNHELAFQRLRESLDSYYRHAISAVPVAARNQGGLKLITGGSARFPHAALTSVRSILLYADTVIIPDPVMPWFEVDRREEQFPTFWVTQAIYNLLLLKPLVDADLADMAVLVVPTFERRLMLESEDTRDLLEKFVLDFFSLYLDSRFEDETELREFARDKQDSFLRLVEKHRLFYPPQGDGTESVNAALDMYIANVRKYRAQWFADKLENLSPGEIVLNAIKERLEPQFHLRDNSEWVRANPMLWLRPHWHYFTLCSHVSESRLYRNTQITEATMATMRALGSPSHSWLGNIPIADLVNLRKENANSVFRTRLNAFVDELHLSDEADLDRVAAEVSRGIASLIAEHEVDARRIAELYHKKYRKLAGTSWLTLAAIFLPWLSPLVPDISHGLGYAGAIALARQYGSEKVAQRAEITQSARSLMGVLAAARES